MVLPPGVLQSATNVFMAYMQASMEVAAAEAFDDTDTHDKSGTALTQVSPPL